MVTSHRRSWESPITVLLAISLVFERSVPLAEQFGTSLSEPLNVLPIHVELASLPGGGDVNVCVVGVAMDGVDSPAGRPITLELAHGLSRALF